MNAELPILREREFYADCEEKFVALSRRHPDIMAVYTAGTVAHPGISDLDFVLCLRNHLSQPLPLEETLSSELAAAIGGGSILKVPEKLFSDIKIIDNFLLRHVWGKEYTFNEYTSETFSICRVLDWLPERLFTIQVLRTDGANNVLRGLGLLKSLVYSLRLVQDLTSTTAHQSFIDAVVELRNTWFDNHSNIKMFRAVLNDAVLEASAALNQIDNWLRQKKIISIASDQMPSNTRFIIPQGPEFSFGITAQVTASHIIVPWSVAALLHAQATEASGFISERVLTSFTMPLPPDAYAIRPDLLTTIMKRMQYVNSLAKFFQENNLTKGLLKYGWYLKT